MGFIPTEEHLNAPGGYIKEAGEYSLRVDSVENVISSTGNAGFRIGLSCTESHLKMDERLWETEKAYWRICLFAKACSVQIQKGKELNIDGSFVGKTLTATVKMSQPNDRGNCFAEIADFGAGKFDSLFTDKAPAKPAQTESGGETW